MPIRIYLCKWAKVGDTISTPIQRSAESQPGLEWASAHHAPSLPDGTPSRDFCMVMVKSSAFDVLDALPGVRALPARDLSRPLPQGSKNSLNPILRDEFKLSDGFAQSANTTRELIEKLALEIHPDFKGFGLGEHLKESDFG